MRLGRDFGVLLLALLLGVCNQEPTGRRVDPGWHVIWDQYRNFVEYGVGDVSGTHFWGMCDRYSVFGLSDGDYGHGVSEFTLRIDDKSWRLPAFRGVESSYLPVDDPAFADRFAAAKSQITFQTDDGWRRTFKPAPQLARFVAECRSLRQRDPDAMGHETYFRNSL